MAGGAGQRLPTPVFNFLKRVVLFQVATITSGQHDPPGGAAAAHGAISACRLEEITGVLNGQFQALFDPGPAVHPPPGAAAKCSCGWRRLSCTFI